MESLEPSTGVTAAPAGRRRARIDARQLQMDFDAPSRLSAVPARVLVTPTPAQASPPAPREPSIVSSLADVGRVERRLEATLGASRVVWTQNRRTVLSSHRGNAGLVVRLHRVFATASDEVLDALGLYLKTGERRASNAISRFVDESRAHIALKSGPSTRSLVSRGAVHDLQDLFDELAAAHFVGLMADVGITWGRASPSKKRRRSIRLGTYSKDELLIRVHPALDREWVPRFFVRFIVFHEMLHHVEPAREGPSRTEFHTPSFRSRERSFHDHDRAIAWERAHLNRLLRA